MRFLASCLHFCFKATFKAGYRYLNLVTEEQVHFGLVVLVRSFLVCIVHIKKNLQHLKATQWFVLTTKKHPNTREMIRLPFWCFNGSIIRYLNQNSTTRMDVSLGYTCIKQSLRKKCILNPLHFINVTIVVHRRATNTLPLTIVPS